MVTHTKVKPFNCEKCGSRFSKKSSLVRHDDKVHCIQPEQEDDHSKSTDKKEDSIECIGDGTPKFSSDTHLKEDKRAILTAKKKKPRERFELLKKTDDLEQSTSTPMSDELQHEMEHKQFELEKTKNNIVENLLGKRSILEEGEEQIKFPKTTLETHIEKELYLFFTFF
jgi:uncharacterized Zn-finger protein